MRAELTLNRLDFGVGQGQWKGTETIADAVKISLLVHAVRSKSDTENFSEIFLRFV